MMPRGSYFKQPFVAASVAFICALVMGVGLRTPEGVESLQPSQPSGPVAEFVLPMNEHPRQVLRFFLRLILCFVLSYLIVFVGLYATVVERSRTLAWLGLGAGVLTAFFDVTENAFFITYALLAINDVLLTDPALPWIYVLANLKWMAAFATLYAFGLGWPRVDRLDWVLTALMLLFPLIGVLGVASPGLVNVRGLFFLVGMPLFAWHFWRKSHRG